MLIPAFRFLICARPLTFHSLHSSSFYERKKIVFKNFQRNYLIVNGTISNILCPSWSGYAFSKNMEPDSHSLSATVGSQGVRIPITGYSGLWFCCYFDFWFGVQAPLFKYSFCSFSNIMSSWCQYEALKYVSFPTQVLAKAFIHSDLPTLTHSFIRSATIILFFILKSPPGELQIFLCFERRSWSRTVPVTVR